MEEQKEVKAPKQAFYFNENNEFIVESNKGIIVNGDRQVRLHGIFTCNSRTMAQIVALVENKPAMFVKDDIYVVTDENTIAREIEKQNKKVDDAMGKIAEHETLWKKNHDRLANKISEFNELPWYKKMTYKF